MDELKGANRYDYEVVKLIRLMDTDDMMLQVFEATLTAIIPILTADDPSFPAEKFIERAQQKVDIDSLLYQMAPIYSRYYTKEEIAELIAFYETPLGSKVISKLPQITQETLAASQAWFETVVEAEPIRLKMISTDFSLRKDITMFESINKLFNLMRIDFGALASQMLEAGIKFVQEQNPDVPASEWASLQNMANNYTAIEILRNSFVTIYNHHYNREEIYGLITFYESPLGRKSAKVYPQITQESQIANQAYFESLGKEVAEELIAENS
jgi:hypothetical protein